MEKKFILDVCCGPRLFWFNKHHPNTIYLDNRVRERGFVDNRRHREVKPDMVADFRNLPFPDKSFKLVIMDPPHLISNGEKIRMTKTYGYLDKNTWRNDIRQGIDESMRVLEDYGVLLFKWNEASISKKALLRAIGKKPLIGQKIGAKVETMWFTFMKIPEELELQKNLLNSMVIKD